MQMQMYTVRLEMTEGKKTKTKTGTENTKTQIADSIIAYPSIQMAVVATIKKKIPKGKNRDPKNNRQAASQLRKTKARSTETAPWGKWVVAREGPGYIYPIQQLRFSTRKDLVVQWLAFEKLQ